jgi:hypothetical protein
MPAPSIGFQRFGRSNPDQALACDSAAVRLVMAFSVTDEGPVRLEMHKGYRGCLQVSRSPSSTANTRSFKLVFIFFLSIHRPALLPLRAFNSDLFAERFPVCYS